MRCVIPKSKFSAGGSCVTYVDSVVFKLTKADGSTSAPCTVFKFDTTCDGSLNADGCGCLDTSGGNIVIDYNVTAVKAEHEGAHWECEPQCYDASGVLGPLSSPNTAGCFNTKFGKYMDVHSSHLISCFYYYHENHFRRNRSSCKILIYLCVIHNLLSSDVYMFVV